MQNDVLYNRIMTEIKKSGGGGGDNGFFEVHVSEDGVLDKTWKEIDDAMRAGKQTFYVGSFEEDGYTNVTRYNCSYSTCDPYADTHQYKVFFYCCTILDDQTRWIEGSLFAANSEDDYPFIDG